MKTKLFFISGILLLFASFSMAAAMRDINAIGEMALKSGAISAPPIDHDFNVIPTGAKYHPNRLLVRFAEKKDGVKRTSAEKLGILQSVDSDLKIRREYQLVPGLVCIEIPDGMKLEKTLRALNKTDGVLYAEPDYQVTTAIFPNDTYFGNLWGMHNTGQNGGTIDADIDAPEAWDTATGNSEIIVAVIDTGVDYTHPDLAANMWRNTDGTYGYDFCNNDNNPWDDNGHGTHCSGTIGAVGNNSTGVVGVCWHVRIMALKFLDATGYGWESDGIECIQYSILMGANLSSNSWGGDPYNQSLKDAIDAAGTAGMLFVAAAGNNSSNNDATLFYPASYNCSNIISVLSTNNNDNLSNFSNWGASTVDIGAPGGQLPSGTYDDILSTVTGGGYAFYCGTSMATPHVAGACALLLSINPSLTYQQVKSIILETRDYKSSLNGLCVSNGRLNVNNAVHDSRVWDFSTLSSFYDSSSNLLAWFDGEGNLILSGTLSQQTSCTQTGISGQKIRASNGTVVAVINAGTGSMCITGSCYERQSSLNPTNAAYVVKDTSGNVIAYINTSGNLYLKGRVYESI